MEKIKNERFDNLFYAQYDGIQERFRNNDYYLDSEETDIVKKYFDEVVDLLDQEKTLGVDDFKKLINVIRVLNCSPEYETEILLQNFYYKMDKIS